MQRSATARADARADSHANAHASALASAAPRSDFLFTASLVPASAERVGLAGRAWTGFKGWLKGAVITLSIMYMVPFFILSFAVASIDSVVWKPPFMTNTMEKSIAADRVRLFGLAPDPSITPEQAGRAFAFLQPRVGDGKGFKYRDIPGLRVGPWFFWSSSGENALDPRLFPTARPVAFNGPDASKILLAVKQGFNGKEKAVLRQIATAGVWPNYDLFAQAPAADLVGGRFQLPFGPDATIYAMPFARFAATKELAYASVSRAAWHLSEGRKDSTEFALRATISFGRVMADNSSFVIEQWIGNVITGIGRTALGQLYMITGDPRGAQLEAAAPAVKSPGRFLGALPAELRQMNEGTLAEKRARLITIATTPSFSPAVRTEALSSLMLSSCTNVRELIMGPNASVRAAFDSARGLARYPSERAVVDLIQNSLNRTPPYGYSHAMSSAATLADFAGRIYFSPRLTTCASMAAVSGTIP